MSILSSSRKLASGDCERERKRGRFDGKNDNGASAVSNSDKELTDNEASNLDALAAIAKAKPLLISYFALIRKNMYCEDEMSSKRDRKTLEAEALKQWQSLEGTLWFDDHDIGLKALSCNVGIENVSHLLMSPEFAEQSFGALKDYSERKILLKKLQPNLHQNLRIAYAALSNDVLPFEELPLSAQAKPALLEGLKEGLFDWYRLPIELREDYDFAEADAATSPSFNGLLHFVKDTDSLWKTSRRVSGVLYPPLWHAR